MKRATASEDGSRVVDGTSAVWDVVDFTFKSDYDSEWERIGDAWQVRNAETGETGYYFPDFELILSERECLERGYIWDEHAQDLLDGGYSEQDVAAIEEGRENEDPTDFDEDSAMRSEANAYMDAEETASARHC